MTSDKPTQAEMERARVQREDSKNLALDLNDVGIYARYTRRESLVDDLVSSLDIAKNAMRKMRLA